MAKDPPRSFWNPNRLGWTLGYTQLAYNRGYTARSRGRLEGNVTKRGQQYAKIIEARTGFLYIYARSENNATDALGRFTQWQYDQDSRNENAARTFQRHVVQNIEQRILRPKVSTGRLLEVTASPKNIGWSRNHWAVGNEAYLNASQAKYWRTQEEGSAVAWKRSFIGDPLVGVFGETMLDGRRAGPPYTQPGVNRAGKFRPYSKEMRKAIIASGAQVARVKRHIRPMNAYKDAWRQSGGSKSFAESMLNELPGFVGRNR